MNSTTVLQERERRWRLVLGEAPAESGEAQAGAAGQAGEGEAGAGMPSEGEGQGGLSDQDQQLDDTLQALYGDGEGGGEGDSAPDIARLLGDVRRYFPDEVAHIVQQDALGKFKLRKLLSQPEVLMQIEPNMQLASQLVALARFMPEETKETARHIVRRVVEEIKERLEYPLEQAVKGSLNRALKTRRPRRARDINWLATVGRNLKHYQQDLGTIIPETLVGHGRTLGSLHDVILCVDQSGSMAKSVVYASIFSSVLASLSALDTRLICFDTNVVDMSEQLSDPVDLLFGLQLKGGTNIERALSYAQNLVKRPEDTTLILISDLFEGAGAKGAFISRAAQLRESGVKVIVLLALSDEGTPRYHGPSAQELANEGVPAFACTPEYFAEVMGAALEGKAIKSPT